MTIPRPVHSAKPFDFGNGRIAGSVARDGGIFALGFYSQRHGYATLEGSQPFPDDLRHHPDAVRAYRAGLADVGAPSLGFHPDGGWDVVGIDAGDGVSPRHRLSAGPLEASVQTLPAWAGGLPLPVVIQRWQFQNTGRVHLEQQLSWGGRLRLGRAALTQLTEGGVLPLSRSRPVVQTSSGSLTLIDGGLDLSAAIVGLPTFEVVESAGEGTLTGVTGCVDVKLAPGAQCRLDLAIAVGTSADDVHALAQQALDPSDGPGRVSPAASVQAMPAWSVLSDALRPLVRRAVAYVVACCAVPTEQGTCLLTDHRILPLTWTRDAYYCARMLLVCCSEEGAAIVGKHLRWLFRAAERPEGLFGRSYLPNGQIKDHAFQLDQQCYPLLELVDYFETTGDSELAREFLPDVRDFLHALEPHRAANHALYATEETPADDPLALPYHFSSHVLLWHTLRRLQWLREQLGDGGTDVRQQATQVHRDATREFRVEGPAGRQFAYAIDLAGNSLLYHDANDLPTMLAPSWGFCRSDDRIWRATTEFGLSEANQTGYFAGVYGGLGSIHTPGPWPLGDVQELLYARLTGDLPRETEVVDRLAATACDDGSLPEARDKETGQVHSRHWFAWPGAALALAVMDPAWQPPHARLDERAG